jgi:hypothetical protein
MPNEHAARDHLRATVATATGTRFCRRGNHHVKLELGPGRTYRDARGKSVWCCDRCHPPQAGKKPA